MLEDPSSRLNVIITISTAIVVGPLPALQILKLLHVLKEKVPVWASAAAAEVKSDAWLAGPPKPNCRLFERQLTSLVRAGQPTARCSQTVFFLLGCCSIRWRRRGRGRARAFLAGAVVYGPHDRVVLVKVLDGGFYALSCGHVK